MYKRFATAGECPIYDPEEFQELCADAGAPTMFFTILGAMTDSRHSEERIQANKKRAVAIIYKLCYGLSQVCNWLQMDHALFLKQSNLNQDGIELQHVLGSTCCRHTANRIYNEVAQGTAKRLNDLVTEAIAKKYQIVLIIDDYTAIHNIRRPTTSQSCNPKCMCTILVKLFRNNTAIPACPATNYHSLKALDIPSVVNSVSCPAAMYKLSQSYSSIMPSWIRNYFFNPELERHRLSSHQYCQHDSVRTMRQMQDVHFVDFVELTLKSKDDFDAAFDIVLSTNLLEYLYLKHFLLLQPGDWPAQFYSRQIIYETLQKYYKHAEASSASQSQPQSSSATAHSDHSYTLSYHSGPKKENGTVNSDQPAILSLMPCIGPLHISLNGQETLFNEFRDFFEIIYVH